jgi:hypothetical protein
MEPSTRPSRRWIRRNVAEMLEEEGLMNLKKRSITMAENELWDRSTKGGTKLRRACKEWTEGFVRVWDGLRCFRQVLLMMHDIG